jgi:hypothetical protein
MTLKRWTLGIIFLISAWGLWLRVEHRNAPQLWGDEHYQISGIQGSFSELLAWLPTHEFSSYISGDHYLMYPFYHVFHGHIWGLALPHVLATIVSFLFLYLVGRFFLKPSIFFIIVFAIFSFNATLIEKAFEIRSYSMLVFSSLVLFYIGYKLATEGFKLEGRRYLMFVAVYVLFIWFHPYNLIMVFLPFIYIFALNRTAELALSIRKAFKFLGVVLLFSMPLWLISIFGKHLDYQTLPVNDTFRYIPSPLDDPFIFSKSVLCNLVGFKPFYFLIIGIPLAFLLPQSKRREQAWFFFVTIILPIAVLLAIDVKTGYQFIQRQFIWIMPFFAILLGWCWESIFDFFMKNLDKSRT